jgi:CBS domain containing-hemolysin-like protein
MSEHDAPAASEAGKPSGAGKPGLFDRLRAVFGLGGMSTRTDIEVALADTSSEDDMSPHERALLKNVLGLHEVHVGDVMVPRADIVAVSLQAKLADVLEIFRVAGHSRLPVHEETLDEPRGMVHIRDFVAFLSSAANGPHGEEGANGEPPAEPSATATGIRGILGHGLDMTLSEANILRPVLFVPASMPALDLLVKMQATRTHMALVIDEYGGTEGLASIEDIVELIVGDIEDEHDLEEGPKIETGAAHGHFFADARAGLEEVSSAIGTDLAGISDAEGIDTLGGLIITLAGHVPARGEIISRGGIEFEVVDADQRRVKKVEIRAAGMARSPGGIESKPFAAEPARHGATPQRR